MKTSAFLFSNFVDQENKVKGNKQSTYALKGKRSLICEICKKPTLLHCNSCGEAYYCSQAHQIIDWQRHKDTCLNFRLGKKGRAKINQEETLITEKLKRNNKDLLDVLVL